MTRSFLINMFVYREIGAVKQLILRDSFIQLINYDLYSPQLEVFRVG